MSFKRWLLLGLLACASGAFAQTNNFNTLDRGGIQVLCKSAVAASAPVDTSEDTLATCNVPANAMGANGILRISTRWTSTANANVKTVRVRFSGAAGTIFQQSPVTSGDQGSFTLIIANVAATNSQKSGGGGVYGSIGAVNAAQVTGAIDTTAATTLVITGQKATAGDTLTLESFLVELMPSN